MAKNKITFVDWFMLALAIVSVGMLVYETWGPVTPDQSRLIMRADYIIVGVFALEFSWRWIKDDRPKTFPLRNWFDILGMIPVSHPAIRGFRLFRVVRIVVIIGRFGRAADRAGGGQGFFNRLLLRYRDALVENIGDLVTAKVLDETLSVMEKGTFTRNMGAAIEKHGPEMVGLVVEKVKADPELGAVKHIPFFDDIVATSSRVTTRVITEMLSDPRMDAIIKEVLRENIEQIRAAVLEKDYKRTHGTLLTGKKPA